jgi:hypothetical protein
MNGESSFEGADVEIEATWLDFLLMLKTREGDDEDMLTLLLSLSTVFSTALDKRCTLD